MFLEGGNWITRIFLRYADQPQRYRDSKAVQDMGINLIRGKAIPMKRNSADLWHAVSLFSLNVGCHLSPLPLRIFPLPLVLRRQSGVVASGRQFRRLRRGRYAGPAGVLDDGR